jgi:hypothetical protein
VANCTTGSGAGSYVYDAEGQRVRSNIGSNWMEDIHFGGRLIAQKTQAGAWTDYIYGGDKRVAEVSSSGTRYYQTDQVGSTRQTSDQNGVNLNSWNYTPFGQDMFTNTTGEILKFTGHQFDYESSLTRLLELYPWSKVKLPVWVRLPKLS